MSLEPPENLQSLRGKLYDKAKAEPGYRFYLLYDKIHRLDVLPTPMRSRVATTGRLGWTG